MYLDELNFWAANNGNEPFPCPHHLVVKTTILCTNTFPQKITVNQYIRRKQFPMGSWGRWYKKQQLFYFTFNWNFVLEISALSGISLGRRRRRRSATGILKSAADGEEQICERNYGNATEEQLSVKNKNEFEPHLYRIKKQIQELHIQMMRWIMEYTW